MKLPQPLQWLRRPAGGYEPRWLSVWRWCWPPLAFALDLLAMWLVADRVSGHTTWGSGFPLSIFGIAQSKAVAAVLEFIGVAGIAYCTRALRLRYLAWRPGPISVPNFGAAGISSEKAAQITVEFRTYLARYHQLRSHSSQPGVGPQPELLDVLRDDAARIDSLVTGIIALLRSAWPRYAYEVIGTIEKAGGTFRVTVQVMRLPNAADAAGTFRGDTWKGAVRQAADHAMASILPRTRTCGTPWQAWRGQKLPTSLVRSYERGVAMEQKRRFDEALQNYYEALEIDPLNLAIRNQIGGVLETLGLNLAAVATYQWVLDVGPGLGAQPDGGDSFSGRVRRSRIAQTHVARYRMANLLSRADVAGEWASSLPDNPQVGPRSPRQAAQQRLLRKRLTETFANRLETATAPRGSSEPVGARRGTGMLGRGNPGTDDRRPASDRCRLIEAIRGGSTPEVAAGANRSAEFGPESNQVHEAFIWLACAHLDDLTARLAETNDRWWLRRWLERLARIDEPLFTLAAVRLAYECAAEQFRTVKGQAGRDAGKLEEAVREIERSTSSGSFRWYDDHYNAACLFAIRLELDTTHPPSDAPAKDLTDLATKATERLEAAIRAADRTHMGQRRYWLLNGDPDLRVLRAHDSDGQAPFYRFEARYFPTPHRTPERTREAHEWETAKYVCELLRQTANSFADLWSSRSEAGRTSETELRDWIDTDRTLLTLLGDVAENPSHWRSRAELITTTRAVGERHRLEPLRVAVPEYESEHPNWQDDGDRRAKADRDEINDLLSACEKAGACSRALCVSPVVLPARAAGQAMRSTVGATVHNGDGSITATWPSSSHPGPGGRGGHATGPRTMPDTAFEDWCNERGAGWLRLRRAFEVGTASGSNTVESN